MHFHHEVHIQSIKEQNPNWLRKRALEKQLKQSSPRNFEFTKTIIRDGCLIRYSYKYEAHADIEDVIQSIRNRELETLARGDFYLLKPIGEDNVLVVDIQGWIPRTNRNIRLQDIDNVLTRPGSLIFSTDEVLLPKKFNCELVEVPETAAFRLIHPMEKRKKRIPYLAGVAVMILMSVGYSAYLRFEELNTTPDVITRHETIDPYIDYKKRVTSSATIGQVLDVAEAMYLSTLQSKLPARWIQEPLTYSSGLLTTKILPRGGRIRDISHYIARNPNQEWFDHQGQKVEMTYFLEPDGVRYSEEFYELNALRDELLDELLTLKPSIMATGDILHSDTYSTQQITLEFSNKSIAYIGLLKRLIKDVPAYTSKLTLIPGKKGVTISITLDLIGFDKEIIHHG